MLQRRTFKISDVVNNILDSFSADIWTSTTTTFLDPAIGGGQFVKEIERRLRKAGHSNENIKSRVFGFDSSNLRLRAAVGRNKLVGTYEVKNLIDNEVLMDFDVVVGNPPFNNADKKTTGGTGGNSTLYRTFRKKALSVLKPGGILAFVSPKAIIKDLIKDDNQVDVINLMTEYDEWKYNTLYFVERNKTLKTSEMKIEGGIAAKMFAVNEWAYREFGPTEHKIGTGSVETVIRLPKVSNNFTVETAMMGNYAAPAAPRFCFTLLESKKSYTVTDMPYAGSMTGCVTLDTMAEAEALKLLIENNKAVRYFYRKMKLKGVAKDCTRFLKRIDLSQIKTGFEYPTEWNLTDEEITIIETNV